MRYQCDSLDGWSQSGGESGLVDAAWFHWTDPLNGPATDVAGSTVAELDQWDRRRHADPLDFGGEGGIYDQTAGFRARSRLPRPVRPPARRRHSHLRAADPRLRDGCMRMPWEIEPCSYINVMDLNIGPQRISEVTYTDSTRSAALTLGRPVYTSDELLHQLHRRNRFHGIRQTNVPQT